MRAHVHEKWPEKLLDCLVHELLTECGATSTLRSKKIKKIPFLNQEKPSFSDSFLPRYSAGVM